MRRSSKKAIKYFEDEKVFKLFSNNKMEMYGVEGENGIYEVKFDILKNHWSCTCKNIRKTPCSHIHACRLKREEDVSGITVM
jgi:hypothetical protein